MKIKIEKIYNVIKKWLNVVDNRISKEKIKSAVKI